MRVLPTTATNAILTNAHVWSPDSTRLVYDCRSDLAGSQFDSREIRAVEVTTGRVETLYRGENGAHCGVATWHPLRDVIVFILGPEFPERDGFTYAASRRQGVILDLTSGLVEALEARDLATFTPGSLAGGTHVHQFSPDGARVSFTYDDHCLSEQGTNRRTVGIAELDQPVEVPMSHPRNHAGCATCGVIVQPNPIFTRCFEESWVGPGHQQVVFQAEMVGFVVVLILATLPDRLDPPRRNSPARPHRALRNVTLRQLTSHPDGVAAAPRHWPRANAVGSRIAFLREFDGVAKLWSVSVQGRDARPVPHLGAVQSAFTWHPDGERVAAVINERVAWIDMNDGRIEFLTQLKEFAPRPEACVVSPDGRRIAFLQPMRIGEQVLNAVAVVDC